MNESLRYDRITPKLVLAVFAAGVMCLCSIIVETALNIAFPILMAEFRVSTAEVQWLTTGFMVVASCLIPASSYLNGRFSKRTLFFMGFFTFTCGVIMDMAAINFPMLLLGRIIQGIGMGIGMPLMFNIILSRTPLSHMGLMMGVGTLNVAAAPAIGPVVGGVILEFWSWRYIFVAVLPFLALALAAGMYAIDSRGERHRHPFDGLAFFFLSLSVASLIYGLARLGAEGLDDGEGMAALTVFLISGIAFLWRNKRSAWPLLNLSCLKTRSFSVLLAAIGLMQIPQLAYAFLIPNFMQISQGLSPMAAALVMCPGAVIGAMLAPVGGRFMDIWGAGRPVFCGCALIFTDTLAYALWGVSMPVWIFTALYVMHMCGIGIVITNTVTNAIRQLPQKASADGNALVTTVQQAACAVGVSLGAVVVAASQHGTTIGTDAFSAATTAGTAEGFLMAFGFAVLAMVCQAAAFQMKRHG